MAMYRQSGAHYTGDGVNGVRNGVSSDHVSIGIRGGPTSSSSSSKQQAPRHYHHHRRLRMGGPFRKISVGCCSILILAVILSSSAFFYFALQNRGSEVNRHQVQDDDIEDNTDFLTNVTRLQKSRELRFGQGLGIHGRDSRYWDKDDRRRDEDYIEEEVEQAQDDSVDKIHHPVRYSGEISSRDETRKIMDHRGNGLYNEAGRDELKWYEAEYEASLKNIARSKDVNGDRYQQHMDDVDSSSKMVDDDDLSKRSKMVDADDLDDDGIDMLDDQIEEYDSAGHENEDNSGAIRSHGIDSGDSHDVHGSKQKNQNVLSDADEASHDVSNEASLSKSQAKANAHSGHVSLASSQSVQRSNSERRSGSKRKSKRRKFSGSCEMKLMNSTASLVEPVESHKFARFSLQYTDVEEKPIEDDNWEPRFGGHQNLKEREETFIAHDQRINCGFVKGPKGSPSTGFDLAEDDSKYISSCHIAVVSCIFGNSDRLRSPMGKTVSRISKKNVCFVMFVDEVTLQTLSSEGQMPDTTGFIGLWKIVVVKNLPYTDMRRVGKIPKFLQHRLFTSARYSIWLDSKLRLQLDPLLILEHFLWRKGYEYAISNHYDRHCLWEEVAQNKRLNKYNHTVIDEQFQFYQADGLKRFNASDLNKLLPSNVPEGSFIVRAHTPMSNLFSCLWFNEVDRFTPRDQLSFFYTFQKLRRMNPEKPFYLNMFKDCERRKVAKLFRHRSEEKRESRPTHEME